MESIQNIFSATLKENSDKPNLFSIISELSFELSKKKIQRLKDDTHIQVRLGELFELYTRALQTQELKNAHNIDAVIEGLIKAASYDKEEFLYKTIYEKEQLEKSIIEQKENIRNNIISTFNILESHIENMEEDISKDSLTALHDAKLRGVEMLGILKETTSEAFLTTLEKAHDIEDTIFEITKNITYQTINEGDFTKSRFLDISSNIIKIAIEIADEDHGNAKELLNGSIHGTKEGMAKAIDKFKNDLKFAPEELSEVFENDLSTIKKTLINIEEDFIKMLEDDKETSTGPSKKIINEILDSEFNNSFAKIKRVTAEARETLSEKIEELKNRPYLENGFVKKAEKKIEELEKVASQKVNSLKNFEFENEKAKNATKEAKRLGNHAWSVAKNVLDGAFKGAKDAINKDK
ncbi:hypothetical protein [Sulfurospirillum arcachonense]|uniref:hypothetical protein n=1 Tax=Sulfurospirillum arcachonense TaxID=57666 RepID=UPI0004682539|nr:hypothetical protein [Sulfurospirillum arcachonense]